MGKSNFGAVGNVNMRGKKHLMLSCRCCSCTDLRETKEARRILRELRDASAMDKVWVTMGSNASSTGDGDVHLTAEHSGSAHTLDRHPKPSTP